MRTFFLRGTEKVDASSHCNGAEYWVGIGSEIWPDGQAGKHHRFPFWKKSAMATRVGVVLTSTRSWQPSRRWLIRSGGG
jgi:hypothetical protein